MQKPGHKLLAGLLVGAAVAALGALWLAQARLQQLQTRFDTDARIAHRLLSQQVVQHDAVMATLALLQPPAAAEGAAGTGPAAAPPRLPSVYPQILRVLQRPEDALWPAAQREPLEQAEAASRSARHAHMAPGDLASGQYDLVLHARPTSYALRIDLRALVPHSEWPLEPSQSPVRVTLEHAGQQFVLQAGAADDGAWAPTRYLAQKVLASPSQPLNLVLQRPVALHELPWGAMLAWCLWVAATGLAGVLLWRQRAARRRAEELLRLGQVARLNTLGELAAGMAHELNQPLTALLSNTQAAQRLLAQDPPDLNTAQTAMLRAVDQARRATAVVGRLRRLVERPDLARATQPLALAPAIHDALRLLGPELEQRGVNPVVDIPAHLPLVMADPVALQQILHNLLTNALQAMENTSPAERLLAVSAHTSTHAPTQVLLTVRDQGPGLSAEARQRLFEPFYSTRAGGLGLGLTLSESLAQAMGAQLALAPEPARTPGTGPHSTTFVLTLALAPPAA